jgi:hypothetical protein
MSRPTKSRDAARERKRQATWVKTATHWVPVRKG